MATTTLPKLLANFETSLASGITEVSTTLVLATSINNDSGTLSGLYQFTIDEGTTSEEHMYVTMTGASGAISRRGLSRVDFWTEQTANKKIHNRGASVKITNFSLGLISRLLDGTDTFNANLLLKGATFTNAVAFSGASSTLRVPNMTTAEKNALTPLNGMWIYDTTLGEMQFYDGGVWNSTGTATVSNASETVAGIIELATDNQLYDGTTTGETGAALVPTALQISTNKAIHWNLAFQMGETIAAFSIVYMDSVSGKYKVAHANVQAEVNAIAGVAMVAGVLNDYKRIAMPGTIIYGDTGLTAGSDVYLNDSGRASTTPGTIIVPIGRALSSTTWIFEPQLPPINDFAMVTAGENITVTVPVPVYISDGTGGRTAGRFYRSDANDSTNAAQNFFGFIIATSVSGTAQKVYISGPIPAFSGLTAGSNYYVSDTVGTLATSPGTVVVPVGKAISTSQIVIDRGRKVATGTISHSAAAGATNDSTQTIGFRPSVIRVYAVVNGAEGATLYQFQGTAEYFGTTCVRAFGSRETNSATALTFVNIDSAVFQLATLTGNGFGGGGANLSDATHSINSTSNTGFVSRLTNTITQGIGATVTATIYYIAEE